MGGEIEKGKSHKRNGGGGIWGKKGIHGGGDPKIGAAPHRKWVRDPKTAPLRAQCWGGSETPNIPIGTPECPIGGD